MPVTRYCIGKHCDDCFGIVVVALIVIDIEVAVMSGVMVALNIEEKLWLTKLCDYVEFSAKYS